MDLKDREVKLKRETLFKSIIVSIYDMYRFRKKEMNKVRPVKNTWYDWLINCIHEPVSKILAGLKEKIVSLFKTNPPKQLCMGEERN